MIENNKPNSLEAIYTAYISITSSSVRADIIKLVMLETQKAFRGINKQDNKEVYISFDDVEDGIHKSGTYEIGLVKIEDVFETEAEAAKWVSETLKSKNSWLQWSRAYFELSEAIKKYESMLQHIDAVLKVYNIAELETISDELYKEKSQAISKKRELEELINPEPIDELDLVTDED